MIDFILLHPKLSEHDFRQLANERSNQSKSSNQMTYACIYIYSILM